MTFTVYDRDGEVLETGIIERAVALSLVDYYRNGAYAEDGAGNRVED